MRNDVLESFMHLPSLSSCVLSVLRKYPVNISTSSSYAAAPVGSYESS